MKTEHLSDEELQQFVFDGDGTAREMAEHISICATCAAAVEGYRVLFAVIAEEPAPEFDFDLPASVLSHIAPKPAETFTSRFMIYLYCLLGTGIAGGGAYYFLKDQQNAFKGMSLFLVFTVIVAAAVFVITQVFDMIKKYQQQINILDFT